MQITRRFPTKVVFVFALVACLVLCFAACTPKQQDDTAASGDASGSLTQADASSDGSGVYVSDEKCLSCHGGSYEALAGLTADYGDSNPHASIHGGYNSCVNCHAEDKEITDNQCMHCHDWPHNPES